MSVCQKCTSTLKLVYVPYNEKCHQPRPLAWICFLPMGDQQIYSASSMTADTTFIVIIVNIAIVIELTGFPV